jgi:hypothetical protein
VKSAPVIVAAVLGLVSGGCAAAGLATGPVFSALQELGTRSSERAIPADLDTVAAVAADTLSRAGMRVQPARRVDGAWVVRASDGPVDVTATVARITTNMARLSLRVETGGIFADKKTAETMLAQVAARVDQATRQAAEISRDDRAISALRDEIKRLTAEVSTMKARPAAPPPVPSGAASDRGRADGGVLVVPASYGLPSPFGTRAPADVTLGAGGRPVAPPGATERASAGAAASDSVNAAILRPVGPLVPLGRPTAAPAIVDPEPR